MKIASPGRVNLIGEHTDYSLGYVMPMAINLYTYLEGEKSEDVVLYSQALQSSARFSPKNFERSGGWEDYVKGIYFSLQKRGYDVGGLRGKIYGNLPIGSGLSSSASLELAVLDFLKEVYNLDLTRRDLALIAKEAENEFVGVPCGVMDQMAIALGKRGHVIFIDTESLKYEYLPFPKDLQVLIFDTGVRRELASSKYKEIKDIVTSALKKIGKRASKEITPSDLEKLNGEEKIRLEYILRENQRVLDARDALKNRDIETLGILLLEAQWDLAKNYGVSSPELDYFVKLAVKNGALGARLTGAGFGGSAIALFVELDNRGEFILKEYKKRFMHNAKYYIVEPSDGVGRCMD